jgi:hypothetical protein
MWMKEKKFWMKKKDFFAIEGTFARLYYEANRKNILQ